MAAVIADSVVVEFLAKNDKYVADLDRMYAKTKKTIDDLNKLTGKPISVGVDAAPVEKSETRKRAARKKTVDQATADDARFKKLADDAAKRDEERTRQAENNSNRRARATDRELQAEQSRVMRRTRTRATGPVPDRSYTYEDARADVTANRTRLLSASAAGDKAAAQTLKDQALTLRLIEEYKRRGLTATEALERAERRVGRVITDRARREEEASRRRMEDNLRRSQGAVGGAIRGAVGGIVGAVSIREISALNDKYIEFTNQLKIAGVEGANQKVVQDALFASAQKYGVELGVLGSLFSRATQAGSELGATQQQILQFTNGVAAAVKIQGGNVNQASGAILQLTQALQSGNVRAQEFNSLLNGLFPVLKAAASGSDEFGGSVAKLRQAMLDGELTSRKFFDLFLKGTAQLEEQAAKATLTTSAGFVTLTNALAVYFGEADKANGVSAAFGAALKGIADNLDTLIPAIAAISLAMGGRYVIAAIAAAAANREMTVSTLALRGALSALQTVGIAAVIGALGSLYAEGVEAQQAFKNTELAAEEFGVTLSNISKAAIQAGSETAGVGSAAKGAEPEIWSLKNASAGLTAQLYDQAKAARSARIETLRSQLDQVNSRIDTGADATNAGARRNSREAFTALGRGDVLQFFSSGWDSIKSDVRNVFSGGRTGREGAALVQDNGRIGRAIQDQIDKALNTPLGLNDVPGGGSSGGGNSGNLSKEIAKTQTKIDNLEKAIASGTLNPARLAATQKQLETQRNNLQLLQKGINPSGIPAGRSGRSGPSAEQLARDALADERAYTAELRRIRNQTAASEAEIAGDIEKRAQIEKDRLRDELEEFTTEIRNRQGEGRYGTGAVAQKRADELIAARASLLEAENKEIEQRLSEEQSRRRQEISASDSEIVRGRLRDEAQMAETRGERRRIQIDLLNLELSEKQKALEESLKIERDEERRDAIQRQIDDIDNQRQRGTESIDRDAEGPLARYRRDLNNGDRTQDMVENAVVDQLQQVEDGITSAVSSAIGVKNPILDALIRNFIQQQLIAPLLENLQSAQGAQGGGFLGGIARTVGSFISGGSAPGRVSGGNVSAGQLYRVNETGVEGFRPAQSGTIIPLGRMKPAQDNTTIVQQSFTLDARGGVTTPELLRYTNQTARTEARRAGSASFAASQQSAPGTFSKYQQLKA